MEISCISMKYQKDNFFFFKKNLLKSHPPKVKYLGINLTKEVNDVRVENYKTLIKET